ncbi:MAG TPA: hypothetical protein VIA62_01125 [Thermoanaerobaculia bacterium]|jgi:hypothetical protein|nr:hypothetical protein [Thermoanaerobaculia bacterium]
MENHRRRMTLFNIVLSVLAVSWAGTAPLRASVVDACAFGGIAGESVTRGIVVPKFEGTNLRTVQLQYGSYTAGTYRITVTARSGSFDGPLVGSPQTAYVFLIPYNMSVAAPVTFDFGGAPVDEDSVLTLTQTVSGPGEVFFDGGMGASVLDPAPPLPMVEAYETDDTRPPLSTYRKARVGLTLTQDDLSGGCIPSTTALCIDNVPGDRRFEVTMDFSHGAALHGSAQAVPTASLGVANGGLFWFFSQRNPEMLVKVLNACSVNQRFWVFFTAGTNVGFTVHVRDTTTGQIRAYANADGNAALPVQDVDAFVCP